MSGNDGKFSKIRERYATGTNGSRVKGCRSVRPSHFPPCHLHCADQCLPEPFRINILQWFCIVLARVHSTQRPSQNLVRGDFLDQTSFFQGFDERNDFLLANWDCFANPTTPPKGMSSLKMGHWCWILFSKKYGKDVQSELIALITSHPKCESLQFETSDNDVVLDKLAWHSARTVPDGPFSFRVIAGGAGFLTEENGFHKVSIDKCISKKVGRRGEQERTSHVISAVFGPNPQVCGTRVHERLEVPTHGSNICVPCNISGLFFNCCNEIPTSDIICPCKGKRSENSVPNCEHYWLDVPRGYQKNKKYLGSIFFFRASGRNLPIRVPLTM